VRELTKEEWLAEGKELFGDDQSKWKFVCPACGHVASVKDWRDAGASDGEIAFSCIGRRLEKKRGAFESKGKGPCDYTQGGLFKLCKTIVDGEGYFDFYRGEK